MKRLFVIAALLLLPLAMSTRAIGQSAFARVSGTISDSSGAVIPGVTVTATAVDTGVVSTAISNETGVYNFTSLLPGNYKLSSSLPGFQTQTLTGLQLGTTEQYRFGFVMKVAAAASTSVEVVIQSDTIAISTSSSSIGEVLTRQKVQDLPMVGNNVLDLIATMSGVQVTGDPIFGADTTTFAGVSANNINVMRDGITANAGGRYPTGIQTATMINPDLVGEIKMILAPVDAESGRGNGQIQIQTRSGTNRFTGSAVWSARNTALNANTWTNNRATPTAIKPGWSNVHQYTVSYGGPIIRNKTFFFALFDGLTARSRATVNAAVLTPCARNGIFRYFDGWNNGNVNTVTNATSATPIISVVDGNGNPKTPANNPGATPTPFTGQLRFASVFGPVLNTPTKADCSDAIVGSTSTTATGTWDTNRKAMDPTGFVKKLIDFMPLPNTYESGDGLNTAQHRWLRTLHGSDNLFGIGEDTERKQINVKIDHNISSTQRANVSYVYEWSGGDDYYKVWPNGFNGENFRRPQTLTSTLTSTLTNNLLNEARFGYSLTGGNNITPFKDKDTGQEATDFYTVPGVSPVNGIPVIPQLGTGGVNFQFNQPMGNRGIWAAEQWDKTRLWTFADTVSLTKGTHSFRTGAEVRLSRSIGASDGGFVNHNTSIRAMGGNTAAAPIPTAAFSATNQLGLAGTATTGNNLLMRNLLTFLSGSLASVNQLYFMEFPDKLDAFEDYRTFTVRDRDFRGKEFSGFFKDDWKITKRLTLNLGVRYDYYGVPYIAKGLTAGISGGGAALFGISGRGFDKWMAARKGDPVTFDTALLTTTEFVGPNSPNPDKSIYPNDYNNIGPAIGFAWQVPWFGEGKTTLRGGYQVTYQGALRVNDLDGAIGNPPGTNFNNTYIGDSVNTYLDLTDLASVVPTPLPAGTKPMIPLNIKNRSQTLVGFDPNYKAPYIQNLTMSMTRSLNRYVNLDVRYVSTLGVKLYQTLNLNTANFLYNGLKEEFDKVRAGGESTMLDQMFNGMNLCVGCPTTVNGVATTYGPVGQSVAGVLQTAAYQMRSSTTFNANLANGSYAALAGTLNTLNYNTALAGNASLPVIPNGENGAVLRKSGLFPENFIVANPQFGTATYRTNSGHNVYHSLEVQTSMRPVHGISYQGTYTWQKGLGTPGNYTNPVDRSPDSFLQGNRHHEFRMNGTFELPMGPNKLFLGNSSGPLARALERWQISWISNLSTGAPLTVGAASMLYNNGRPDIVGPFPKDVLSGVRWGGAYGNFGGMLPANTFIQVIDPQCAAVTTLQNLQAQCNLDAMALRNPDGTPGQIVLQTAQPGKQGTLGQGTLEGPGNWTFDASASKTFRISESKSATVRIDTRNVLNHPTPGAPAVAITGATFGNINTKSGNRTFQGQLRFSF